MNYLPLRIWLLVSIALALGAVIVRLVWEVTSTIPTGTVVIIILLILVTLGTYVLLLYFTIKPGLKKLRSLPVRISVTIIITATLISGIIHFVRFVALPPPNPPLSVIIASLLLMASISAYSLVLWVIWFIRKARES
jgi:hypothetical protein